MRVIELRDDRQGVDMDDLATGHGVKAAAEAADEFFA